MAKLDMDIKQIRVVRLRQLIADKYTSNGAFADAHGMKRPQVSRWLTANLDARQGIAEESARQIEKLEKLPPGWLDRLTDDISSPTITPLTAKIFALRCDKCGHVSHQSFVDLEANDSIACESCSSGIVVADYYGQTQLAEFLKSIGATGFSLRKR